MFRNKVALVTGANRGIGRAIAVGLAKRACKVYVGVREVGKGSETLAEIAEAAPDAEAVEVVIDLDSPDSMAAGNSTFGVQDAGLHILINNAGMLDEEFEGDTDIFRLEEQKFRDAFEVNTMGALRVVKAFRSKLKRAPAARVINISSGAGQLHDMEDWAPAYSISKTALNAMTRQMAAALGPGIAVNCMCPGWVRSDMGGPDAPRSLDEGAETAIWLALDADHALQGKFFKDKEVTEW